jgi:hypothetical protein
MQKHGVVLQEIEFPYPQPIQGTKFGRDEWPCRLNRLLDSGSRQAIRPTRCAPGEARKRVYIRHRKKFSDENAGIEGGIS